MGRFLPAATVCIALVLASGASASLVPGTELSIQRPSLRASISGRLPEMRRALSSRLPDFERELSAQLPPMPKVNSTQLPEYRIPIVARRTDMSVLKLSSPRAAPEVEYSVSRVNYRQRLTAQRVNLPASISLQFPTPRE